jgi:uncharacterized membrane protein
MSNALPSSALRERILPVVALVVSLVGLGLAVELARIHLFVHTDPDFHSVCAVSERVNCETVAESRWSVFAGVPVAVWGIAGYLLLAAAAGAAIRRPEGSFPAAALLALSAVALAAGIALAAVSVLAIDAICPYCIATYGLDALLVGLAWAHLRRRGAEIVREDVWTLLRRRRRPAASIAAVTAAATVGFGLLFPAYWNDRFSASREGLATGEDEHGHPWIGATNPSLVVHEHSDYLCPYCRREHERIRAAVSVYPDRLRLVHVHFPLDPDCNPHVRERVHPDACVWSAAAACAAVQGRFWEANDALYTAAESGRGLDPAWLSREAGLDAAAFAKCLAAEGPARVARDVAETHGLGIRSTPTHRIGDQTYAGGVPVRVLAERLER